MQVEEYGLAGALQDDVEPVTNLIDIMSLVRFPGKWCIQRDSAAAGHDGAAICR